MDMQRLAKPGLGLLLVAFLLSGCALALAGTAGGLIVDEGVNENDGAFDPLENTEIGRALF